MPGRTFPLMPQNLGDKQDIIEGLLFWSLYTEKPGKGLVFVQGTD